MNWQETRNTLIAAGIPAARLPEEWQPGIDLRGADLSRADLTGVNLRDADLRGADLRVANLRDADLREASLTGANLRAADLTEATLREADLRGADLSRADLTGVNLSYADLTGAVGPFTTFSAGRHTAVFAGGYGSIGCFRRTYDEWLADYAAIGAANGYTPEEIAEYGQFIALAVARQRRIEAAPDAGGEEG